jgi:adenylate kinase family enzyme
MEKDFKYKRIIILGGSGSGKSTLANRISLFTRYPAYHLDNLFLNSKWEIVDKSKWDDVSKIFLSKDIGVVDGNYNSAIPNRVKWADLVVYIDISTWLRLRRLFVRSIRIRLGLDKRYGVPDGSKEKLSIKFLLWAYRWNKNKRDKMFEMLESIQDKKVLIIKEPKKLDLKELFK